MIIYPAIDIKDNRCVQLKQGDFDRTTVFNEKPAAAAKKWEEAGARFLHIVDLDGARFGGGHNNAAIREIIAAVSVPVQVGGGIRTLSDVDERISMGVSRVILGTVAVKDKELVKKAVSKYGGRIAVGIDARDGIAAVSGWEESGGVSAVELCLEMKSLGINTVIYTDITKDGMMSGPNIEATRDLIIKTGLDVIASGGVSRMEDIINIKGINASGAIIGTAIYTGAIDLKAAIEEANRG